MHLLALKTLDVMSKKKKKPTKLYLPLLTAPPRHVALKSAGSSLADKYESLAKQGEDKSGGSLHLVTAPLCGESSGGCELRGYFLASFDLSWVR